MRTLLEFLNKAKETNDAITSLSECVRIADALKVKSATAREDIHEEMVQAMKSIHSDFKQKAKLVQNTLSEMKDESNSHYTTFGFDRSFSAKHTHMQSLAKRLALVVEDFRRVQSGFAKHEGDRLKTQYLIAKPDATEEELVALEEKGKARPLLQSLFTIGSKSAKDVIMRAERRRSSIDSILRGISDLKELSDDFVGYITTNTTEVDRVHVDVKNSLGQAKLAERVIEKAAGRTIRAQKVKKATTLLFVIFLVLSLIYLFCKLN